MKKTVEKSKIEIIIEQQEDTLQLELLKDDTSIYLYASITDCFIHLFEIYGENRLKLTEWKEIMNILIDYSQQYHKPILFAPREINDYTTFYAFKFFDKKEFTYLTEEEVYAFKTLDKHCFDNQIICLTEQKQTVQDNLFVYTHFFQAVIGIYQEHSLFNIDNQENGKFDISFLEHKFLLGLTKEETEFKLCLIENKEISKTEIISKPEEIKNIIFQWLEEKEKAIKIKSLFYNSSETLNRLLNNEFYVYENEVKNLCFLELKKYYQWLDIEKKASHFLRFGKTNFIMTQSYKLIEFDDILLLIAEKKVVFSAKKEEKDQLMEQYMNYQRQKLIKDIEKIETSSH